MSHFALSQTLSRLQHFDLYYPALCKKKKVGVKCYNAKIIRLLKFKPKHEESLVNFKRYLMPDRSFLFVYFLFLGLFLLIYWYFHTLPLLGEKNVLLMSGVKRGTVSWRKHKGNSNNPIAAEASTRPNVSDMLVYQIQKIGKSCGHNFSCNIWTKRSEIGLLTATTPANANASAAAMWNTIFCAYVYLQTIHLLWPVQIWP